MPAYKNIPFLLRINDEIFINLNQVTTISPVVGQVYEKRIQKSDNPEDYDTKKSAADTITVYYREQDTYGQAIGTVFRVGETITNEDFQRIRSIVRSLEYTEKPDNDRSRRSEADLKEPE